MSETADVHTNVATMPPRAPAYLGDGVQASFDGHQIWLTTDRDRVALDPGTFIQLLEYASQIWNWSAHYGQQGRVQRTAEVADNGDGPGDSSGDVGGDGTSVRVHGHVHKPTTEGDGQ